MTSPGSIARLGCVVASSINAAVPPIVGADPYFDIRRDRIVALATQQRLTTIYQFREFALAGGVIE